MSDDNDDLNGDSKDELLSWFGRRGFDLCRTGINTLGVCQLRALAGYVTRAIIKAEREGERKAKSGY